MKTRNRPEHRVNERIFAKEIRLIDKDGKQIGILSRDEALKKAKENGVDIVEIAPKAEPPVAKLIEYSKFLYQEKKRKKEERKKSGSSDTKQLRFGPFIDDHDLDVKLKKAKKFFEEGNKVKFVIRYKGRQLARKEAGFLVTDKIIELLEGIGKVDREPKFEGRQLTLLMSKENLSKKNENGQKKT